MAFFVRNQKFIQFVTWLKKNFQDQTKIDKDIDKFDEDVLMMNRPSSAFGALAHLIFDSLKQFFDGFDRNFASLVLDSISQFVKGFCLPSTIIHSLFEDSPVLFHSRGRLWPADSSPLEEIGCSFLAEPVTRPNCSVQRPNQVINSMSRHCDVAC